MKRIAIIIMALILALVVLAVPAMADYQHTTLFPIGPEPIPNTTYEVDVDTQNLGPDSWRFSYTITDRSDEVSGDYSGFDGFRILIPKYSVATNVTLPDPYYGSPGYWATNRWDYGDGVYDVFQFWGEGMEAVYPIGEDINFSFEMDGVAVDKNDAALVSYFRDRALSNPDNQDAWYDNFYIAGGIDSPVLSASHALLEFYQDNIESHSLYGTGKNGQEKLQRENAFENMLQNAINLIDQGDAAGAVQQLWSCYYKVDSKPNPPDFINGNPAAKGSLANMILAAIDTLSAP